jgi:hypothetical protein
MDREDRDVRREIATGLSSRVIWGWPPGVAQRRATGRALAARRPAAPGLAASAAVRAYAFATGIWNWGSRILK